jgi:hypothetical protein
MQTHAFIPGFTLLEGPLMTDTLTTVTVPCQHLTDDGTPCEAAVTMTVEYTPPERRTWDYPGTDASWGVVGWGRDGRCRHNHIIDQQSAEWKDMVARAIHTAQEENTR